MKNQQHLKTKTSHTLVKVFVSILIFSILFLRVFNLEKVKKDQKSNNTSTFIPSGSYIIDMGSSTPTAENSLLPYGLIYALTAEGVAVHWSINSTKTTNGVDLSHNGKDYKGGPFIIDESYIDNTISGLISTWEGKGVIGDYTVSDFNAPVYGTLYTFPVSTLDNVNNASIIEGYFSRAEIPTDAYKRGAPDTLGACDDIYLFPHAYPTWADHSNLKLWNSNHDGYIWAACHSVSILENLFNPSNPSDKMNFLSTNGLQCYKSGKCGSTSQAHNKTSSKPYNVNSASAGDPIMQFIGTTGEAHNEGSEKWYIPLSNSAWNNSTTLGIYTSDGSGNRKGTHLAYGRAFGHPNKGMVMYESGHKVDKKGSKAEQVNALGQTHQK